MSSAFTRPIRSCGAYFAVFECGQARDLHQAALGRLEAGEGANGCGGEGGETCFRWQSSRFFESMIRQRADFDSGKHGNLFSVEAHYHADHRWFLKKDWAKNGGLKWLYGGLSHPIDLVRWYMPDITEGDGIWFDYGKWKGRGPAGC